MAGMTEAVSRPSAAPSGHVHDKSAARWFVVAAAILQVLVPALPALGFGQPIGSQSDDVRTLITPAGWAFSIWGPLYTGAFVFAYYQFTRRDAGEDLMAQLRLPAALAFIGNAAWALYTQSFGLSAISALIIIFTLVHLLQCYRVFSEWQQGFTKRQRWMAVLPLSALAAWLTAATIVNIAASLKYHGVEAGDIAPPIAAAIVVVGGVIAAIALARGRGNPPYALVFLWALVAIYSAGGQQAVEVAGAVAISAVLVVAGAVIGLRRARPGTWVG